MLDPKTTGPASTLDRWASPPTPSGWLRTRVPGADLVGRPAGRELAGQIMVAHPSSSGTSYTALCTILQLKGEEEGWKYLRDYASQVNQFTKSGAAPATLRGPG